MGLFQILSVGLLAATTWSQELGECSTNTTRFAVSSTEDAASLAASLACVNGDFSVTWIGNVVVAETMHVMSGTSLNIIGAGPNAIADGGGTTQLFILEKDSLLQLSSMTLANGSASGSFTASGSGGAVYAHQSTVHLENTSFISNHASDYGGAIFAANSTVRWDGDGVEFNNNAATYGGAIYATSISTVLWDGDGTEFNNNTAFNSNAAGVANGGAIFAFNSTVGWTGDGTQFNNNSAVYGGAIYAESISTGVFWFGDGTQFTSNSAVYGGAIFASGVSLRWTGDGTQFSFNSALDGGAIYTGYYEVVWTGNGTKFNSNIADEHGGAICATESKVYLDGTNALLIDNVAGKHGGAIYAHLTIVRWGSNTTFSSNMAAENGGALASIDLGEVLDYDLVLSGASLINNVANDGGALYLSNCERGLGFTESIFHNNSASAGGAVAAYEVGTEVYSLSITAYQAGTELYTLSFESCSFSDNRAIEIGGAVQTISGHQEFVSCDFEENSAGEEKQTSGTVTPFQRMTAVFVHIYFLRSDGTRLLFVVLRVSSCSSHLVFSCSPEANNNPPSIRFTRCRRRCESRWFSSRPRVFLRLQFCVRPRPRYCCGRGCKCYRLLVRRKRFYLHGRLVPKRARGGKNWKL